MHRRHKVEERLPRGESRIWCEERLPGRLSFNVTLNVGSFRQKNSQSCWRPNGVRTACIVNRSSRDFEGIPYLLLQAWKSCENVWDKFLVLSSTHTGYWGSLTHLLRPTALQRLLQACRELRRSTIRCWRTFNELSTWYSGEYVPHTVRYWAPCLCKQESQFVRSANTVSDGPAKAANKSSESSPAKSSQ